MTKPIQIATQRLLLRPWQPSDHAPFVAMGADPEVMRYFPSLLSPERSLAFIQRINELFALNGWGLWAVECKQSHHFIGFVGLYQPTVDLPFTPCIELAWRLAVPYWGKGYATEAAKAVLKIAFQQLDLVEVVAYTAEINQPSRRVMERLGMQYQGGTFAHPHVAIDSILRNHVLYRLKREQWNP